LIDRRLPEEVRGMERAAWLKQMRDRTEALYDRFAPKYWVTFGLYANETHRAYLGKFLERVAPRSTLLSAACGAGRYDGMLLEGGHHVVGIDQSAGMLARARERFPEVRYEKLGLQEMDFQAAFEGAICIDAMEHVPPEDWPGILHGFREALKPGGVLYFTLELAEAEEVAAAYERAKKMGLPVVLGELVDEDVYHYYPGVERVRAWIGEAGLAVEAEGTGNGYVHFVVRKEGGTRSFADGY
jgi:SAM-dependent methyltransferase